MTDRDKIEAMLDHVRQEKKRLMKSSYSIAIGNSVQDILRKLEKIAAGAD